MPRKRLPWIKLWFEMLGDPKMTRLTLAERGCWHEVLLLAGQSPIRGKLMLTETEPMTMDDIARALSLTPDEYPVLESCVEKLIKLNSLRWNAKCLEVIHFIERQDKYPSDFKDYHKKSPDKFLNNSELSPDKLRKEEEGRGERKKKDITSSNDEVIIYSLKTPDEAKQLFDLWNSLGIVKHRRLTRDMTRAIKATSSDFSAAEISQAMRNYAHIVKDEQCYFGYRWTLKDFLKRGLEKFLDLQVALSNYRKEGIDGAYRQHPEPDGEPYEWEETPGESEDTS